MINLPNDALREVSKQLRTKGDSLKQVLMNNKYGHRLIETNLRNRYYIVFKKEYYKTFGDEFGTKEGYGESINVEYLDNAIARNAHLILFVHTDAKIYAINPIKLKAIGHKRIQKNGVEMTYSVPLKALERWDSG